MTGDGRRQMPLTVDQAEVLRWFFSEDAEDVRLSEVRKAFEAVGWHSADDVQAALFPGLSDDASSQVAP